MNRKLLSILCLFTLLFPLQLWAQEPYAVLSGGDTNGMTLTFYYDTNKGQYPAVMGIGPFSSYDECPWSANQQPIETVVFDASFADYYGLTSTAFWFSSLTTLNSITGIENLKTDNVTDMTQMFVGCVNLTSLDLSGFNTYNVTDMMYMFAGCENLTTIYVSNGWDVSNVTNGEGMFMECYNLKGSEGTEYNQGRTGVEFAHVDEGENNPGYFTYKENLEWRKYELNERISDIYYHLEEIEMMLQEKDPNRAATELWQEIDQLNEDVVNVSLALEEAETSDDLDNWQEDFDELEQRVYALQEEVENYGLVQEIEPYAVLSENNTVLTFYYDEQMNARGGMSVVPFLEETDRGWHDYRETITSVVFDASFADCTTLTSTAYWFYEFDNLTSIIGISNLKTGNVTDMRAMFRGCSKLSNIDLSSFNTSKVEDLGYMFRDCSSLTTLNLSNFITDNVIEMSSVFDGCSALIDLDLGSFNTSNVTDMHQMFNGCNSLTNLSLTGFNTEKNTTMFGMFSGCSQLTILDLSSFNTANVTAMHQMFEGCSALTTIFVSDGWTTIAVEDSEDMFAGCYNLKGGRGTVFTQEHTGVEYAHIDGGTANPGYLASHDDFEAWKHELIERLNEIHMQIEDITAMLQEKDPNQTATGLWQTLHDIDEEAITINSIIEDAQTVIELEDCEWKIEELEERVSALQEEVENYGLIQEAEPYAVLSENNTVLTFYYDDQKTARGGIDINNSRIGDGSSSPYGSATTAVIDASFADYRPTSTDFWFQECSSLISITGMEYLNTENVTSMNYMFFGCSGLTSLDVSAFNTQNVTYMVDMFSGCSSLTSLDVSGFNTQNVTSMDLMFYGCSGLTSLDMSGFKTDNVTNMLCMFYGCSSLTSLDVSGFNTENVRSMSWLFYNCSSLTSLDVTGFNTQNVTNMSGMFGGCSGLTSLDISSFNTQNVTGMGSMFSDCSGMTTLDVTGLNTQNVTNMSGMFGGCSGLTSLDLSNFNTNNVTNMVYMFAACSELATIYVGSDWSTVAVENGDNMFANCINLMGGRGTVFTQEHTGLEYAHIDGGTANPGYFASHDDFEAWKHELIERLNEIHIQIEDITEILQEKDPNQTATGLWQTLHDIDEEAITINSIIDGAQTIIELEDCEWKIEELENRIVVLREDVENYGENTDPIAYGVFTNNMRKLTFYYDMDMGTHNEGIVIPWEELLNSPEMQNARMTLEIIEFNPSFANLTTLTTTGYLFSGCMNLTAINGLEYLVTDNMTDMREMFASCESLTELDLRSFNTSKVTMMWGMFQGCLHLTTILVGDGWTTAALTDEGHEMFAGCNSLVGGMGTTYSDEHFDADYAHIDGGSNNPGYLTGTEEPVITEFEVDGIFYRVHDQAEHKVTVAHVMRSAEELYVPDMVEYARIHWNVTALGEMAFADMHEVKVIGIPESIDSVSVSLFNHCPHLASILWKAHVPLTAAAMGQFNNPNLLFYATNIANAPASVTNVIDMTTYMAERIVLSDADAGGNDFYCPEPFMVKDISYTHSYDQATKIGTCQGWESIVVPFDVQTYTHETKGEIYPISTLLDEQIELDGDKPFWLYAFNSNDEFMEAEEIRANTPYILSMPNDPDYWDSYILRGCVTFSAKNIEVYPTREVMFVESPYRVFMPNFENIDYENPDMFLLNVGDAYDDHLPGSVFSSERPARKARPFEAYFIPTGHNPVKRYMDVFGSEVDAVREIPVDFKERKGTFDLTGRKMEEDIVLPKGIYIIDGKKVMVK